MGSLVKMAEYSRGSEEYTLADKVKIAAAVTVNFVSDVRAQGGQIKQASAATEINHGLVKNAAVLIVMDEVGMFKEAGAFADFMLKNKATRSLAGGLIGGGVGAGTAALTGNNILAGAGIGGAAGAGLGFGTGTKKFQDGAFRSKIQEWFQKAKESRAARAAKKATQAGATG